MNLEDYFKQVERYCAGYRIGFAEKALGASFDKEVVTNNNMLFARGYYDGYYHRKSQYDCNALENEWDEVTK